jgi:hypothetical protein
MKALEEGKQLHALMLKHGTEQTIVLDTKLINILFNVELWCMLANC